MSESEDLELLKVTELQNELKKRGLDTKGRKADLITRLRQAMNNGIEGNNVYIIWQYLSSFFSFLAGNTSTDNPDITDEESAPAVLKDETSSPSSVRWFIWSKILIFYFIQAIEDDDEDDDEQEQESLPPPPQVIPVADESENPPNEPIESTLSKKRFLTDDEEGEENENEKLPNEDIENDELAKQPRKKKSRWGSEQEQEEEESPEKQTTTKRASDDEDNVDNSSTTSSNKHRDRDHHRSSKHDDDRHYSSRRSERYRKQYRKIRNLVFTFDRSPEKELPLPEEETVQFNPEDVVLDFCKSY